ncbi:MAG TPA: tetratricopeptide repeat protein [Anaerolineales bacterium]|nr:tetratricopeptide repeat protein [Anaerolineales bacterium]
MKKIYLGIFVLVILGLVFSQLPPVKSRLSWRVEVAKTYLRGVINPVGAVPTAKATNTLISLSSSTPEATPALSVTPTIEPTATGTPEPLPAQVSLSVPNYELQDMNNCGPASLTMALRYYGWDGDQFDISEIIKPIPQDRNVNPEEMVYYVRNYAGWLRAEYRVNGNLYLLKKLIAAGYPVLIEETFHFDEPYYPNDDLWAAHYLLLTAYDDKDGAFIGQDSYQGANQRIPYETLMEDWKPFNRVYMLIYLPEDEDELALLLGDDWDEEKNRENARQASQRATEENPDDAFAWFNLGSNLLYFEEYAQSANAYDQARSLGLPQRMMRYQFGAFIASFQDHRTEDLLALTKYALQRTPNSEEALLWRGWGLYQQGDYEGAIASWELALKHRPNYFDAEYALDFAR